MNASFKHHLPCLSILLITLLLLFFRSFDPQLTLSVGDVDLAVMRNHYRLLPTMFSGPWIATTGLGSGGGAANPSPGILFAYLVPFFKYVDANALFHLFILGLAGYFFIHDCTRNRFASLAGGLFLMLQPHVLSHLLPGHVGHFLMSGWIVPSFLFTRRSLVQGGLLNWTLAGICFGLLLMAGQHDVAAFIGLTLAAYGLFRLALGFRDRRTLASWLGVAGGVGLVAVLASLLAYQAVFGDLIRQVTSHRTTASAEKQVDPMSSQDKWFWATQWSVPPIETLDAAVPGFFGWGSSDRANPYRGRIGQTEGWMEHRQGMPNLNDVCQYLGAIMLLGVWLALILRRRDPEVWFFAITGSIALVLSFGKFGPLYHFFYSIPGMETLRNPIKWYYVTSLCAGILGALGWAEAARAERAPLSRPRAALLAFLPGLLVLGLAAVALARLQTTTFPFWQQSHLVDLSARAITLAALFWGLGGLALFLILPAAGPGTRAARAGMGLAVLVLIGELAFVNSHYMPYHPWALDTQAGPFNEFLAKAKTPSRFRFLRQDGIFYFLHKVVEIEGMEHADPYATRLPDAYMRLQREMEPVDPLKFWRLCNVRYVVTPGPMKDPSFQTVLTLKAGPTTVVVNEFTNTLPRCFWVSAWRKAPEQEASALMRAPAFDPGREALIHADSPDVPEPPAAPDFNAVCRIVRYEWNRIRLETTSDSPGLVVCLNRYDPDYRARVDGRLVPHWKANGVMQACAVPAGTHTVEFAYEPQGGRLGLRVIATGWILAVLFLLAGFWLQRRSAKKGGS